MCSSYLWISHVHIVWPLTSLLANSSDDQLMIFFLFDQGNKFWHFMQIVSLGDNLHEMSKPVFWKKNRKKKFQYVVCWKFYPQCYALKFILQVETFFDKKNRQYFFFLPSQEIITLLYSLESSLWLLVRIVCLRRFWCISQHTLNFNDSNTDASFTVADSNSFFWVHRNIFR